MMAEQIPPKLIVALDVPSAQQALALAHQLAALKDQGLMLKVGMQLFYAEGPSLVKQLTAMGFEVFVDLKLHDIPNTVAQAVTSLVRHGVTFLNVHTQGGPAMMQAAVDAARDTAQQLSMPKPTIIGVTLLTSMNQADLTNTLHTTDTVDDYVLHLAQLAKAAGLDGVVCSAQEAQRITQVCGPSFLKVTPGIRPAGSDVHDQSRILTPAQAIAAGSTHLVVGRPITQAAHPAAAAQAILDDMQLVLSTKVSV